MSRNSFLALLQRRRNVLLVTLVIALLALPFIFVKLKPTYVAVAHVMLIGSTSSIVIPDDMGSLTMSEPVMSRVAQRFGIGDVDTLRAHVDAKPGLRSSVMPISYRDQSQSRARTITNALADETVRYYKDLSGGQYDKMLDYLQGALIRDSNDIRSIDAKLQQAAQRDTFAGSERGLENITSTISTLNTERGTAYATMVADEAIASAQSAQHKEIAGIVKQEVLANNPMVQALRAGQSRDAAQLELERSQFTNKFPGLPSLGDQVGRETSALQAAENSATSGAPTSSPSYATSVLAKRNALAIAAGDRARVEAIDAQIADQQAHLRNLPVTGATVSLLRAQRDSAQAAYQATVLKLNDTKASQAAASSLGALVVIDHAADASPRIPRWALDLIVAFLLLALTLSVGVAVDVLDPSLRSPESVEKLYGIPVIGNIGSR